MPNPFISQQDLSDLLGRDVTEDEGALAAVDAACDWVRTMTGQTLNLVEEDAAVLDGTGTPYLVLPQFPVTEVKSVSINEEELEEEDWKLAVKGVLVRPTGVWNEGNQNVEVTYSHGYAAEDFPRDLRMVALMIAQRLIVQGVASFEAVGPVNVRYAVNPTDLSSGEKIILAKYRRTR